MEKKSPDEVIGEGIGRRLREIRGADTRAKVQEKTGIHPNTLAHYEGGRVPDAAFLARFAAAYDIDESWLITGRGSRRRKPQAAHEDESPFRRDDIPSVRDADMVSVPMLDIRASAGPGQIAESEVVIAHMPLPRAYLILHGIHPDGARMAAAEGDSMSPDIGDGDPIVFDVMDREPRDKTFLFRRGGQLLIKKLQRRSDGTIALLSTNPAYAPEILPRDESDSLEIIGRVGLVLRSL